MRSEMALARRIAALTHRLSDANLAAMPEFHLRVGILRHLQCAAQRYCRESFQMRDLISDLSDLRSDLSEY